MQKLSNLESQRVMSVLGDCLDNLHHLSSVPVNPSEEQCEGILHYLTENRCESVAAILKKQWHQENVHSVLQDELQLIESDKRLSQTTRKVVRELREHPQSLELLLKHCDAANTRSFINVLSSITDITYNHLLRTVEDDEEALKFQRNVTSRANIAQTESDALSQSLNTLEAERAESRKSLSATASKIQAEIDSITTTAASKMDLLSTEMKEMMSASHVSHTDNIATLVKTCNVLKENAVALVAEHRDLEALCRKKKQRQASELQGIVNRYNTDMEIKNSEIASLKKNMEYERQKFNTLHQYFQKLDDEALEIEKEKLELKKLRESEDALDNARSGAATNIQKIFRGNVVRRNNASKKKKKKK